MTALIIALLAGATDPAIRTEPRAGAFAEEVPNLRALPIRKPEVEAEVVKVVPAKETEKDVLATVFLKGRDAGVPITKATAIHKQMGKLVPVAEVGDIKVSAKVSLWLAGEKAEAVLIFP